MKKLRLAVAASWLASCSSPEYRAQQALMENIEQSIRMPTGAKPLASYVRYYAPSRPGEIVGIFILPGLDELPPGEGCEQLRENGSSTQCSFSWPKSSAVGAGKRVWLSDDGKLPMPMRDARNCGLISIVYQTSQRRFLEVACYGQTVDR